MEALGAPGPLNLLKRLNKTEKRLNYRKAAASTSSRDVPLGSHSRRVQGPVANVGTFSSALRVVCT